MKFGFSAVELLLVAGIISILVAMSVPRYLEMKVRAEVVDVKVTMRDTTNSLYKYKIDYGKFPETSSPLGPNSLSRLVKTNMIEREPVDRFKLGLKAYGGYYAESYLFYDSMYHAPNQVVKPYARLMAQYNLSSLNMKNDDTAWILRSIGPDQMDYRDEGNIRGSNKWNKYGVVEYDATNGVFSPGEITSFRTQ
jgi:type II secretory pathway pseudopilin PulG